MKILLATDCNLYNVSGVTTSVLALSAGLRRLGHEVRTLSFSDRNSSFRRGDDYYIRSYPALYYPGMRISFAKNDPLVLSLEAWKPDVIHVHTEGSAYSLALVIKKHTGAVLIKTCHAFYDLYAFGKFFSLPMLKSVSVYVGGRLYGPAVKVIVPSAKALDFPILTKVRDRLVVIPNGVDTGKYKNRFTDGERSEFRRSLGIPEDTGVLVTVSRLSIEKQIDKLLLFFTAIRRRRENVRFLIVGDGPYKKRLERLADKLGIRDCVIFTGRIAPEEVWRYFAAGDIYAAVARSEVHSMSYLEAMCAGLPLLCSADRCLEGVLEHGVNGFVWHSGREFVSCALKLLREGGLRAGMGRNSAAKAEKFSVDAYAGAVNRLYKAAVEKKKKGRSN